MDQTKLDEIESTIRSGIVSGVRDGWKLRPGTFGMCDERCGCALTLLVRDRAGKGTAVLTLAAQQLGVTRDELWSFTDGFDGNILKDRGNADLYWIGRGLRAEFVRGATA
jgi:hypothetical protein